jgi:hypothetical protein
MVGNYLLYIYHVYIFSIAWDFNTYAFKKQKPIFFIFDLVLELETMFFVVDWNEYKDKQ